MDLRALLPSIEKHELRPVLLGALYFFCLLASYYMLRPVRDEMGIRAGVDQLQWLFTATFLVMLLAVPLFGWASSRLPRAKLIPAVYLFFAASLVAFYFAFTLLPGNPWPVRGFFVWISVYILFVVSVFWSYMADIFSREQGKRLFGLIAAGGSIGAIAGPSLAAGLAQLVGTESLLPIAATLLLGAMFAAHALAPHTNGNGAGEALAGSILEGAVLVARNRFLMGIALFIWLYTTLGTLLYFQQATIVGEALSDSADRTSVLALVDLSVNTLTLVLQFLVVGKLMTRLGIGPTLAGVPALLTLGFLMLALSPVLLVILGIQVLRRGADYGLTQPAQQALYTTVDRTARYKAKNFLDTVVFRGGDALAGWLYTGLKGLGMGLAGIAMVGAPLALAWAWLGYRLGKQADLAKSEQEDV